MPHHIVLLAAACEIARRIEEGVTLLDDALQIVERTGERWLEAELNRHKAQLLLRRGAYRGRSARLFRAVRGHAALSFSTGNPRR
jgi:predicted ATPase